MTVKEALLSSTALPAPPRGRLIVLLGRGRTGKTTLLRFIAEEALALGAPLTLADCDRTNATATSFFPDCRRPLNTSDYEGGRFVEQQVEELIVRGGNLMLDVGGGDTVFLTKAQEIGMVELLEGAGFDVIAIHCVGSGADDVGVLQVAENGGLFAPRRTAIVLNAAFVPEGAELRTAFARVLEDPAYQAAVARGARTIHMPLLRCAERIEDLRISFADASDGGAPEGCVPLGVIDRQRTKQFRRALCGALQPIQEWLPWAPLTSN